MEIKKNPKSNLENYSKTFMQIGLVLALFVSYVAMEKKSYDKVYTVLGAVKMNADMEEDIPITERKIEPIKPKTPPPIAIQNIDIVEDEKEVEETVIESTETDETEAVQVEEIEEIEEEEEVIDDVPVFPGCKGNNAALKVCFNKKIHKHFSKEFNAELPNELGLSPGKKKIYIGFKIDKIGNVINIQVRAPHPKIKKEVLKIMKLLPKIKPGRQRGRAVGVKYSIPFTLIIE